MRMRIVLVGVIGIMLTGCSLGKEASLTADSLKRSISDSVSEHITSFTNTALTELSDADMSSVLQIVLDRLNESGVISKDVYDFMLTYKDGSELSDIDIASVLRSLRESGVVSTDIYSFLEKYYSVDLKTK